MELFFRKHFWIVTLVFLLACAFLTAKTVNVWTGNALEPEIELVPSDTPTHSTFSHNSRSLLSNEAVSKITGIPVPPKETPEETQLAQLSNQDPVRTSLNVRLLGTVLANSLEWSMATLDSGSSSGVPSVYMIGDTIQSATILEIERKKVIILNAGRKEYIDCEVGNGETGISSAAASHVASAIGSSSSNIGSTIKSTSENTYEIPKSEINDAMGNLNNIAMQARVVPAFKNGVATGFKLFSIRPNSLYTKIGLVNGDIIRRINGYEINDPAKALEVYTKLKESARIEIELERNGSSIRKVYNVR